MDQKTIILRHVKSTKNKEVFDEVVDAGQAPTIEGLYLPKWAIGSPVPEGIEITLKPL